MSSHSGLALVGAILDRSRIRERLDMVMLSEHPFPEISHGEIATAMLGLICLGKPDFDDIILEESARLVGRIAPAIIPCHGNLVAVDIDVTRLIIPIRRRKG